MAILTPFNYVKAKSLSEVVKLLRKHKANAMVLAGGTDLVGHLKEDILHPKWVIDIKALKELKKIEIKGSTLHIGALVTYGEIVDSKLLQKKFPVIVEIAKKVASVGIRNRATLVGNICSAVPCLDSGPILVAMDGLVLTKSSSGLRQVPAAKWFVHARKTSRKPNEIVLGVKIPLPKEKYGATYIKLGRYNGEDLAQASVFTLIEKTKTKKEIYRIAFGSVAPVPVRATKIEKVLNQNKLSEDFICQAKKIVGSEVNPITDLRATKEYRLHMCEVMLERALKASQSRMENKGPAYGEALI